MSLRPPEPGSFEDLLRPVRIEVASLVRLSRSPATEPYWSGGVHRFDDPERVPESTFRTCYAASAVDVAFARAIHDASKRWDGIRFVSRQMNKGFAYAVFKRSGLRKLHSEKLRRKQLDELCDRFNVCAV